MKQVDVGIVSLEGFTTALLLQFDNGLILRTHINGGNLAWCGTDKKKEVIQQFKEVIQNLEDTGLQINGKEILDEA